ncbi:FHA domain-containing protein [Micrococcales bacterium KH10]|nr:FHA domain-containing protein [Micrococcales bacterium KH10]
MGVLDRIERGVEKVVNSSFKRSRSQLKPVELASAVRKEADDKAMALDRERTVVPNVYHFKVATTDLQLIESWGREALAIELAEMLTQHATKLSYALVGAVSVDFAADTSLHAGQFKLASQTVRSSVAPSTGSNGRHPMIDIDGQRYLLTGQVTVIGRGSEADIVVDDPGISRRHLEFRIGSHGVVATDLGSTNGLYVEGHQVPAATLVDGNTLTIGRTRILFWDAEPVEDDG